MRAMPLRAKIYVGAVVAVTLVVAALSLRGPALQSLEPFEMAVLVLAIVLTDFFPIALPQESNAEVTISCAVKTATAIALGPHATLIVALVGTFVAELAMRREWYKVVFNTAEMSLTFYTMSLVYNSLYDGSRVPFHSLQNAVALVGVLLAYYVINTGLVTTVVSLASGARLVHIWKANFRDSMWNNLTIIPLGAVTAALWLYSPWSVLALALPMIAVRQSFQYIADLQKQTREALVGMADAIDRRDPSTYQHSQRVAQIADAIAVEIGMPTEEVEVTRMAGRLHDLGKIGMANALLFKPGRFDEQEQAEFRHHPEIGAGLVKGFRLFREGQNLILYHHERFDGKGYPAGLAGEEIPLGSRILAAADSFDAMTAQRVYRQPLSIAQAREEVSRNSGTQFDPQVAVALLRVLDDWRGRLPWTETAPTHAPQPTTGPQGLKAYPVLGVVRRSGEAKP